MAGKPGRSGGSRRNSGPPLGNINSAKHFLRSDRSYLRQMVKNLPEKDRRELVKSLKGPDDQKRKRTIKLPPVQKSSVLTLIPEGIKYNNNNNQHGQPNPFYVGVRERLRSWDFHGYARYLRQHLEWVETIVHYLDELDDMSDEDLKGVEANGGPGAFIRGSVHADIEAEDAEMVFCPAPGCSYKQLKLVEQEEA